MPPSLLLNPKSPRRNPKPNPIHASSGGKGSSASSGRCFPGVVWPLGMEKASAGRSVSSRILFSCGAGRKTGGHQGNVRRAREKKGCRRRRGAEVPLPPAATLLEVPSASLGSERVPCPWQGGIWWVLRSLPTQSTPFLCIDPPPGVARCLGMCPEGLL